MAEGLRILYTTIGLVLRTVDRRVPFVDWRPRKFHFSGWSNIYKTEVGGGNELLCREGSKRPTTNLLPNF